mmetsp:Transcript_12224/g.26364  ORF Transcript_12224/g.26364 Transcript_12224/m.26364 type:complete len:248 (-) Transcript_12224:153-896(-)
MNRSSRFSSQHHRFVASVLLAAGLLVVHLPSSHAGWIDEDTPEEARTTTPGKIVPNLPPPKHRRGDDDDDDKKDDDDEKGVVVEKEPSDENADSNGRRGDAEDDGNPKKGEGDGGADSKDYDQVGDDGKKIPHGKIGFENLAKLIGKRWQELDAEGIEKYKKLADRDMTRYKTEMEAFLTKEAQGGVDGDLNSAASTPGFYSMMHQKRKKSVSDDDDSEGMGSKKRKKKGNKETLVKKEDDEGRVEV